MKDVARALRRGDDGAFVAHVTFNNLDVKVIKVGSRALLPDESTQRKALAQEFPCHRRTDETSGSSYQCDTIFHDPDLFRSL